MYKKTIAIIACIVCLSLNLMPQIHGATMYSVKRVLEDGTYETVYTTSSYTEANQHYTSYQEQTNYALFKDERLVKVRYGIVSFAEGKGCNYTVNYTNATSGQGGYTNGCYGADGLYLDTNDSLTKVLFQLSNALGWAKMEDVTLYPYEAFQTYSSYFVRNGHLYHQIKTNVHSPAYSATLDLGIAPSYLQEDSIYYSYDGKYFYDNFYDLRDDNYNYSHQNAINYQNPYYNYYQYLSNRTLTQYSVEELNNYITNILGIDSSLTTFYDKNKDSISEILNQSQYFDMASTLVQYQYQYGANALMMLAISSNETASGRSGLAFYRNNLFGHDAYDSNVEANASRYQSVASSIASHAKHFVSKNYSNPKKFMYHGSYFGDKGSGMNVSYASDPYWGEKAAQYYMRIDTQLGGKDYNAYAIGIKSTSNSISIYSLPSSYSTILYNTGTNWDYSFVLLDKLTNDNEQWYKVQIDPALNEMREQADNYYYDFEEMVGYIRANDIQYILNEEKIGAPTYTTSIYDAKEGSFVNGETVQEITHRLDTTLTVLPPVKENAIFQNFVETSPNTFEAHYKEVDHCWIEGEYQSSYMIGESLNLNGMNLMVLYTDGTKESIPVTTSMVSVSQFNEAGAKDFTIYYQGISTQLTVLVKEYDSSVASHLASQFNTFFDAHPRGTELSDEEIETLSSLVQDSNGYGVKFSYDEIRYVDEMLRSAYDEKLQVIIKKNPFDLSFSGLSYLIPYNDIKDKKLPATLHVSTQDLEESLQQRFQMIVEGNGWHFYDAFEVAMQINKENVDLNENYIVSIAKPEGHDLSQNYILLAEKDGNIYRFFGQQSDTRIFFQTQGFTKFAVAYLDTNNEYSKEDIKECYRFDNNGYNVATRMTLISTITIGIFLALAILIYMYLHSSKKPKERKIEVKKQEETIVRMSNVPLEEENEEKEH